MSKKLLSTLGLYAGVGILSVGLAALLASRVLRSAHSQPSNQAAGVDPEILKQLSKEDGATGTAPSASAPPVPSAASQQPPASNAAVAPMAPPVSPTNNKAAASAKTTAPPAQPGMPQQPGAPQQPGKPGAVENPAAANLHQLEGFLQSFEYSPQGKRDPFAPPIPDSGGMPQGPVLPLQRYDLDQLRLTGIIWDVIKPKAMVRDPAGQVHIVIPNDKMGRNNGYVAVIREGEIVVVEPLQDEGRVVFSTRLMKLAK